MAEADAKTIDPDASVAPKRRFDVRDWDTIAEQIVSEEDRRKRDRKDREKQWADIDRQIAMLPDLSFKTLPDGKPDLNKRWMAEIELPLQAQALEVLKADARRLMFPDTGLFFRAHGAMTDKFLESIQFESIILGDQTEVPSHINQDNVNKLVEGFLGDIFAQTDLASRLDRINAESFKYGMGVARARMESKSVFIHEAKGTRKETEKIPVLVPVSIKNTYLDDPKPSMHSDQVLGPAHISVDWMRFENLALAASRGSNDPNSEDGGWMPANMKKLLPDDRGFVKLLEMEGDIIVPRKTTRSFVIPNAIVTVAVGGMDGDKSTRTVVRCRYRKYPFSSYLLFPYQYESADDAYPTSPLMKGRPVQILATDAANRMLDSAALKIQPPVGYDKADQGFGVAGGPRIAPGEMWPTVDPNAIKAYHEIGGDPATMGAMLTHALNLYAELTGVLPGRVGAQTVSHTTAYAKGAELQRGAVRTVNYVNASGQGPIARWLDIAYRMGRDNIKGKVQFFIESYGGFVEVSKDQLPEDAVFEWLGSGAAQDENQKMQNKVNAALLASKLDQINISTGKPPRLNLNNLIDEIMRSGGWLDLDAVTNGNAALAQPAQGGAVAAIQNLTQQMPQ